MSQGTDGSQDGWLRGCDHDVHLQDGTPKTIGYYKSHYSLIICVSILERHWEGERVMKHMGLR